MLPLRPRTLPSPKPICIPPACGVFARVLVQRFDPGLFDGATWNGAPDVGIRYYGGLVIGMGETPQ